MFVPVPRQDVDFLKYVFVIAFYDRVVHDCYGCKENYHLIYFYSQTCLMWPSKGTVKYGQY